MEQGQNQEVKDEYGNVIPGYKTIHEDINTLNEDKNKQLLSPEQRKINKEKNNSEASEIIVDLLKQEKEVNENTMSEDKRTEVLQQYILKNNSEASEIIVDFLKEKYVFKTLNDDKLPEIWYYRGGVYSPNGMSLIKEEVRNILRNTYTTQKANQVIEKIMTDSFIEIEAFFNKQNELPYAIPVKNGLLHLNNNDLGEFRDDYYFFNKLNAKYNPGVDCPNFKKFVNQIVENPDEDVKVIQELFGFSLIRDYKFEKAFMLYGKDGRNGKSKLLEVLTTLLGVENTSDVSLQDLETEKYEIGSIQNKLVNISADISDEAIKGTGRFKHLTGRDTIQAQRKFKTSVKFKNYAKMIFAANKLPPINNTSNAFWLRWVIINFPYQFLPQKEINALNPEERSNVRLQDTDIIKKLTTPKELSGILNWAIEGLNRLEQNKDFSNTQTAKELKIEWLRESNSVIAFIMDNIEEDYDCQIEKQDFKEKYYDYCRTHKIKSLGEMQIKITLENKGITDKKVINKFMNSRVWKGIKWKSKPTPEVEEPVFNRDTTYLKKIINKGHRKIEDIAKETGVSQETVETDLDKLKISGDVYENKPGEYILLT